MQVFLHCKQINLLVATLEIQFTKAESNPKNNNQIPVAPALPVYSDPTISTGNDLTMHHVNSASLLTNLDFFCQIKTNIALTHMVADTGEGGGRFQGDQAPLLIRPVGIFQSCLKTVITTTGSHQPSKLKYLDFVV